MITDFSPLGTIAFIATPEFRGDQEDALNHFIRGQLYWVCQRFTVLSTGRTYDHIRQLLYRSQSRLHRNEISEGMGDDDRRRGSITRWRETILSGLKPRWAGIAGMIEITHELIEGRVDAVLHFTDWVDVATKADSMVLRREANVHGVPIASDIQTAISFIKTWQRHCSAGASPFRKRVQTEDSPLKDLKATDRVLALIGHDGKKLELCCFVLEHMENIFDNFDFILTTGHTGHWLRRFVRAAGRGEGDVARIRLCQAGPSGGDVQIATAVVRGICKKVIFLQDPFVSHAHEPDIHLIEQSILLLDRDPRISVKVEFATNVQSAEAILGG